MDDQDNKDGTPVSTASNDWRPISTADKRACTLGGGNPILMGYTPDEEGYFPRSSEGFWKPSIDKWVMAIDTNWHSAPQPTHWMPLPEPPLRSNIGQYGSMQTPKTQVTKQRAAHKGQQIERGGEMGPTVPEAVVHQASKIDKTSIGVAQATLDSVDLAMEDLKQTVLTLGERLDPALFKTNVEAMEAALDSASLAVDDLKQRVLALMGRVDPVLFPAHSTTCSPGVAEAEALLSPCELVARIVALQNQVSMLKRYVDDSLAKLAIYSNQ